METSTLAQIYLADQRGVSEPPGQQILHTLNFQDYTADGRQPVGALRAFNQVTLQAGATWAPPPTGCSTLLFPLLGGLEVEASPQTYFLEPGQAGLVGLTDDPRLLVRNPYDTEVVAFLHLNLNLPPTPERPFYSVHDFDLSQPNQLHTFLDSGSLRGFIGRWGGRQEGTYPLAASPAALFVHVLQGAFEVANRLLHTGDALALQYEQPGELEFEALAQQSLLLMLDLGPTVHLT